MAFKKKFAPRRKFCRFCADAELALDYKRPDILRNAGAIFGPITLPTEQRSHDRPCHEQAEVRRRRQQNRAETDNNR